MTSSSSEKTDEGPNVLRNKLVTVNSSEICAAISLVKARIKCKDIKKTTNIDELSQILAELGQYDLAV